MFVNRTQAGTLLAKKLLNLIAQENIDKDNLIIVGMATGGIETAISVTKVLRLKLQIIILQRLMFSNPEETLSVGAVGLSKSGLFLHKQAISELKLSKLQLFNLIFKTKQQIQKRYSLYSKKYWLNISDKTTVVLIDDGIATGEKILAAAREIIVNSPQKLIIATPIINKTVLNNLKQEVEAIISLEFAEDFFAVSQWYQNFDKLTDYDLLKIL